MIVIKVDSEVSGGTILVQETDHFRRGRGSRDRRQVAWHELQRRLREDNNQLIANAFSARKIQDEKRKVRFPQFLALAWAAANAKAKEIGWIA